MPSLTDQQHRNLAFWGLTLIAVGLPLSIFLVSVGSFVLAGNWMLEGRYAERLRSFFSNRLALIIISIFVLFVLGMVHTGNWAEGLNDLRIKLPILILPLLLFTSKMPDQKRLQDVLLLFVLACVVGTILGTIHFAGLAGNEIVNKRAISVIISHIRFGLMLAFAIFILIHLLSVKWKIWSMTEKLISLLTIAWLFYFMVLLETFTAYLVFAILTGLSLLRLLTKSGSSRQKLVVSAIILLGGFFSSLYLNRIYQNHIFEIPFDHTSLLVKTANGNYYAHENSVPYRENGHRVWNFVCMNELRQEWALRSAVPFDSLDQRGQPIKFTLVRYMTSRGLLKDSAGASMLSPADLTFIERGFTNYRYTDEWGVSRRVAQLLWEMEEYEHHGNANNSSLLQRWVYFKVGLSIVSANPLFGVGTGDIETAYESAYNASAHGLLPQLQGISHNQFLSVAIVLGILGLLWFAFAFFYPLTHYFNDYLYLIFLTLILVSFMTDNTLDSQMGVTLFAFFNSFLIVRNEHLSEA